MSRSRVTSFVVFFGAAVSAVLDSSFDGLQNGCVARGWVSGPGFTGPPLHVRVQLDGQIVASGIEALKDGLLERQSADVVKTYRDSALALQQAELEKALRMLEKGADPEEVLGRLARDLTNKLIHAPTAGLRQLAKEGGKRDVSKMAAMLGLTDFDDERDEGATLQ